jgi:hypothetical protein
VWIIGDTHALGQDTRMALPPIAILEQFKAWRDGRLFHNYKLRKPERNAFGWYSTSHVYPDQVLADLLEMFYPDAQEHALQFFGVFDKRPYLGER